MNRKLLLVEDDASTREYVRAGLTAAGYQVDTADNGREGLFLASEGVYDLIVADRMLPGLDGLAMLRAIRGAGIATPAMILSALGRVDDRVDGLRGGADDYLTKPFSFEELSARIEALLRRGGAAGEPIATQLVVGDLTIDLLRRSAERAGRNIPLGAREFAILEFLARHEDQVVTRTMLLEKVWNYHFDPGSNVVDVHVGRLRRKIEDGFAAPLLHTIRGSGYRLSTRP